MTPLFGAAMALLLATTADAQDSPAEATPGGPPEGYTVAIHEGSCPEPIAEPAWQLDNAVSLGVDQDDPEVVDTQLTRSVTNTSGKLDVSFDHLTGSEHAIAVHASPDDFGTLVACGNIAGIVEDGNLVVAPVGESGVTGIAIIDRDEGGFLGLGSDETQVTV